MKNPEMAKKLLNKPSIILIYFLISSIIILFSFYIRDLEYYLWTQNFTFLIAIQFVIQIFLLKALEIKLTSLFSLFLILSYFFHFGQLVIVVIDPNYEFTTFNFLAYYNDQDIIIASEYALYTLLLIGFGPIFAKSKEKKTIKGDNILIENNLKFYYLKCRKIGWTIVLLLFPIQLYLDLLKFNIAITEGYIATYYTGISGIWSALGFVSFTGIALLILGYSQNNKKSLTIFLAVIIYLLLSMITGHRGHQLTIILFYIFLIHNTVYKFKGKRVIIAIAFFYIGLGILNSIAEFRILDVKNLSVFWSIYKENLAGSLIKDVIVELGGTINTLILVMQQIPSTAPYSYGVTYITSIFSVLPNIGNIFNNININSLFTNNIQGSALGGTYIGELYYNFSYFGLIIAVFFGYIISVISNKIDKWITEKHYIRVAYFSPLFMYILWLPRDSVYSLLRPFIWCALIIWIINIFWRKSVKISRVTTSKNLTKN